MKHALRQCEICGENRVRDYHHIVPKCLGGSDKSWNRVNLCPTDHRLVHKGLIVINGWDDLGYTHELNYKRVEAAQATPLIPKEIQHKKRVTRSKRVTANIRTA